MSGDVSHTRDAAFAKELQRHLHNVARVLGLCDAWCVSSHELTVAQSYSLLALPARGAMCMNELSAAMNMAGSTMTRVVDQLVNKALAERTSDGEDRRIVRVALSGRGREVRDALDRDFRTVFAQMAGLVDEQDRPSFLRGLRAVAGGLGEMHGGSCWRGQALEHPKPFSSDRGCDRANADGSADQEVPLPH